MKEVKIRVGSDAPWDEVVDVIRVAPITLVYDGTYGTENIEYDPDKCYVLDCTDLPSTYHMLTDHPEFGDGIIKGWASDPAFVYLWVLAWHGNVADKLSDQSVRKLPTTKDEFNASAHNVKYIFALLSAWATKMIQVNLPQYPTLYKKLLVLKYPESQLHPAIQANLAEITMAFTTCGMPKWVAGLKGQGSDLVKQIIGGMKINGKSK